MHHPAPTPADCRYCVHYARTIFSVLPWIECLPPTGYAVNHDPTAVCPHYMREIGPDDDLGAMRWAQALTLDPPTEVRGQHDQHP